MPLVQLYVWGGDRVRVREREPARWPEGCPERHIEAPGTFCLGRGNPLRPTTEEDADTWWSWLGEFLKAQFFVDRNRFWPTRFLHQGTAADIQVEMEELAKGTPLEADVKLSLDEGAGWLANQLPRLTKDKSRLVNLRSPCPRGCFKRKTPLPKGALTLDAALLARARDLGINVSQASERGLAGEIKRVERKRWLEENREALDGWNRCVEEHGLPLESLRLF